MSSDKLKELGIYSPQESIAKAIFELSSEDKIKMLSSLKKEKDVFRFALIFNVAEELGLDWLEGFGKDMLKLRVSLSNGRGRRDIVTVVKQPTVRLEEGLKERIKSFIRSE